MLRPSDGCTDCAACILDGGKMRPGVRSLLGTYRRGPAFAVTLRVMAILLVIDTCIPRGLLPRVFGPWAN